MAEFTIAADGVTLAGSEDGEGTPVVLLHGLTATRRYVVMGSRSLQRSGHHVVAYDARGHGSSSPAPEAAAYNYGRLADDLTAVLDGRGINRAVLAGASMGAHTALRFALDRPERVAGLAVITPAHDPDNHRHRHFAHWDELSRGLRRGGVEGFLEAYDADHLPEQWRETATRVIRQRLAAHEHPEAVADALRCVPRSEPFGAWDDLDVLDVPAVVVASRDEADPGHPYAVAERYAEAIPGARLLSEDRGSSPLAWQGGQLSKVIAELAAEAS